MAASSITRGASLAADVWGKLDKAIVARGGTENALHILAKDEGAPLLSIIADLLVQTERKILNRFPITVDYSQSLDDMVRAGRYEHVAPLISKFSVTGQGRVETEALLVHFPTGRDLTISSSEAARGIVRMGLIPAKIEHLLALGAAHPDLQREFVIVALDSSVDDVEHYCHNPYLAWGGGRRLYTHHRDWSCDIFRFLALRKVVA